MPAVAVRGDDDSSHDRVGYIGAVVVPDHAKAQVDAGGYTRGGEHAHLVHDEHVRIHRAAGKPRARRPRWE